MLKKLFNYVLPVAKSLYVSAVALFSMLLASLALMLGFTEVASAVLDPSISTGLTAVQTDFTALLGLVYPIMISITAAIVIFGLAKMFIHKAAGK